ncbi:MgtC/SapB family protein [Pseudomarimonas salicorniae]|uniref:Protein MgtC n=1 Tax=Pseudomarimonas salicorniae TaxID=2933270 RepID=A0ABT0GL32_9GAMM|nr:MgtC/SapB family protein [Lysobacter sp. CAU 1642]MCK7595239.1 MgtC/SapB family protein [Lysobacter sp. CAU 1642]
MEFLLTNGEIRAVATVGYAMLLGGVIGLEREVKSRPAGFRTHMLVAGAAAFLVSSVQLMVSNAAESAVDVPQGSREIMSLDPLRLVEAVVAGVSFIGAGCIFASRERDTVHGVTTAASLLMVASIGLCTGLGYPALASSITLMTLVVLLVLKQVEKRMPRRDAPPPGGEEGRS